MEMKCQYPQGCTVVMEQSLMTNNMCPFHANLTDNLENVDAINFYKICTIYLKRTPPTRFGRLWYAENNYGEPRNEQMYYATRELALQAEREELKQMLFLDNQREDILWS